MNRFKLSHLAITSLIVVGGCDSKAAPVHMQTPGSATGSCEVRVLVNADEEFYRKLASNGNLGVHMTCPIDTRSEREATLYLPKNSALCAAPDIAGFRVLSSAAIADPKVGFRGCSNLMSGFERTYKNVHGVDAYLWTEKRPTFDFGRATPRLGYNISLALMFSGVPITGFLPSNVGMCFEENAGTNLSPKSLLNIANIELPSDLVERRFPGETCDKAIQRLMPAPKP